MPPPAFDESPDQLRAALREAEERLRGAQAAAASARRALDQILERVTDAFVALDTDWRFTYVNQRAAEICRRRPEDLIGRYLWTEFPEAVAHPIHRAYRRAAAEQVPVFTEEYYEPLQRWFEHRIYPSPEGLSVFFQDVTERRQGEETLRTLSRRLLGAQEEERRRVARELHDEVGQVLTAVKIQLQSLRRAEAVSPSAGRLDETIESVDRALGGLRLLAFELRPSLLDDLGLAAALRWLTDRYAAEAGLEVTLSLEAAEARLPPEVETACFRVAQEALTNVARHAGVQRASVALRVAAGALELSVADPGAGFDVDAARRRGAAGGGMGLAGMEERTRLAGGRFQVRSEPGRGTEVHVRFAGVSSR